jgi:hypothetical protein
MGYHCGPRICIKTQTTEATLEMDFMNPMGSVKLTQRQGTGTKLIDTNPVVQIRSKTSKHIRDTALEHEEVSCLEPANSCNSCHFWMRLYLHRRQAKHILMETMKGWSRGCEYFYIERAMTRFDPRPGYDTMCRPTKSTRLLRTHRLLHRTTRQEENPTHETRQKVLSP